MKILRDKGETISWHTAVAVALSVIGVKDPDNRHKYEIGESWARSLFRRMKGSPQVNM